jgi:hypothetical protein
VIGVANIHDAAGREPSVRPIAFSSPSQSLGMIQATAKAMFEAAFARDDWAAAECAEFTLRSNLRGIAERAPNRLTAAAVRRLEQQFRAEFAHAEDHDDWRGVAIAIDLLELALDPISARLARNEIRTRPPRRRNETARPTGRVPMSTSEGETSHE